MLESYVGGVGLSELRQNVIQRTPFAMPGSTDNPRALFDWDSLASVMASHPAPDTLVVARGELVPLPPPTSLRDLGLYLRHGVGLCIRHSERHHAGLRSIATMYERAFPGSTAQVQLFVTPRGTHGFTWHYDDEDVFITQTLGKKDYLFRENTVAADAPAHSSVFARFREERSPLQTARLHPGDFLYIPSRWWHMAECLVDSLSISVGVMGATR